MHCKRAVFLSRRDDLAFMSEKMRVLQITAWHEQLKLHPDLSAKTVALYTETNQFRVLVIQLFHCQK